MDALSPSVFDAKERARQYWFIDGLSHLLVGVGLLSFSMFQLYRPPHGFWGHALWVAFFMLSFWLSLRQRQIVEWLKFKITYPRTGYAQSPFDAANMTGMYELGLGVADERRAEAQRLGTVLRKPGLLCAALGIGGAIAMLSIESRWVYPAIGVLIAMALWALRKYEKVTWLVILGFPVLGACMMIFSFPGSNRTDLMVRFIAGWGGLFVLDGAITLTRYLMRNRMSKVAEP